MLILRAVVAIAVGYLLGSIPSGLLIGRSLGIDVRATGSGKTGATNVLRSAGWAAGVAVMLADILKSVIAILLAQHFFAPFPPFSAVGSAWVAALTGLAAIAGHNYPIYVGFKGGRGVATTGAMMLALAWPVALVAIIFFIIPIIYTRYVSLGSMIGAMSAPFLFLLYAKVILAHGGRLPAYTWPDFFAFLIAGLAVVISHRDNIQRIREGNERRLGERATPAAAR